MIWKQRPMGRSKRSLGRELALSMQPDSGRAVASRTGKRNGDDDHTRRNRLLALADLGLR
jgi:hypothetical protein